MFCFNIIPVSPVGAKAGAAADAELAKAIMARQFRPSLIGPEAWEGYIFSDLEIRIKESTDLYGAVLWPSVRAGLCCILPQYLQLAAVQPLYFDSCH